MIMLYQLAIQCRYYGLMLMLVVLSGCTPSEPLQQQKFYVFGTLVEVSIWGLPASKTNPIMSTVANDLQVMHYNWHAWKPGPLTELNQAIARGESWSVPVESQLIPLLERAQQLAQHSENLFNPAIGQLIELWGFHDDELPTGPPPSAVEIEALVALKPTMADLKIKDNQVSSVNPAVQLDFGAFAKGYAIDLIIEKLREYGIHNAIVNAGGNLKAIGQPGKRPWRIGIRDPSGQGVLAAVTLTGEESVVTSGNYERYRQYQGQRYSHILDPRSGWPVESIVSVTVIDIDAALADAAATALTVAGLDDWHRIAQQLGLEYVMLVDASGQITMNPAMANRIEFQPGKQPQVVISPPLL